MQEHKTIYPFSTPFLEKFSLTPSILPFSDTELVGLDGELAEYEQVFMNPDTERYLMSKNEMLASFAISKAENSTLTLREAEEVYKEVVQHEEYGFLAKKLAKGKKLTRKDHEKLEFFNIAKTFRELNRETFRPTDLTPLLIRNVHASLTRGMDVFHGHLHDFTVYKSGQWRDNDLIRIGEYAPAPFVHILTGVEELITWFTDDPSITRVAIFHTALYALHPFNNGNKRVCRVLEHVLLRSLGINTKNLYSTSYYYHKEKARYYKYLLYSLERRNLNHFTAFVLEALTLSIATVLKTSLEVKRSDFLIASALEEKEKAVLKPLVKRGETQFKTLWKLSQKNVARQTLVTYLQHGVDAGVLIRREAGRAVYYRINIETPEDETLKRWLEFERKRLAYIPDSLLLSVSHGKS